VRATVLAAATAGALLVAGCGDDGASGSRTATAARPGLTGDITVLAAASLTDAFTALGEAFDAGHPGARVSFNFGASSALREQILGGAPADVFASADQANVDQLIEAGAATASRVFASNQLEIAVPPGNPGGIKGLTDFADPDLLIGLCAEEVPCGQLGRRALRRSGVEPAVDTNAPDVRALLTQVESGDLDAGLVYVTDGRAAGGAIDTVAVPAEENVRAAYPIAALEESGEPELAAAFVDFVTSAAGREILAAHGFGGP
jgi:molybdate transport system substrate-binding protein